MRMMIQDMEDADSRELADAPEGEAVIETNDTEIPAPDGA